MYGIYDMKNNEMCIGIFDKTKQVADYFNTTTASISSAICRKQLKKHRYLIERFNEEE